MNERRSPFDFVVPPALHGERLDRAMAALVPGLARGEARRLIAAGVVFAGGRRTGICSRSVRAGERVSWELPVALAPDEPPPGLNQTRPRRAEPRVLFEQDGLIVVDKPAGMPVEPTRQGSRGTLIEWLRARGPAFIAHRLDVATSGLLAAAREHDALVELNALFAARAVDRRYLAVISPPPDWDALTMDQDLDGRRAVTHAQVLERGASAALLQLALETGRTQQIRRHLRGAGHRVVGESEEGARTKERLLLHAHVLAVPWPRARPAVPDGIVRVTAAPPSDFVEPAQALGLDLAGVLGPS